MEKGRTEYKIVTGHLKALLRREKIKYRDLAKGLGLSESGVKKILGAEDGSFQRLSQICSYLGVTLSDVLAGVAENIRPVRFSDRQQRFLLDDPKAFALYWKLVYERETVTQAMESLRLTEKAAFSLLRKLDENNLLKLLPGGRVRVPPIQVIRWERSGPLVEKLYREWTLDLVRAVSSPAPPVNSYFMIRYFKVKPKTYTELLRTLSELENEFVRRAARDMRTGDADLMHLRWVTACDGRSFVTVE